MLLVLQHASTEGLGTFEGALKESKQAWATLRLDQGEPVPRSLQGFEGLIVLGGPMNVEEEARYPFLRAEVRLLRRALVERQPVLGICLGAQLLAKAAGATVTHGPALEIGWHRLELTPAARQDPLFHTFPASPMVVQWHGDTFTLPEGSTWLARSSAYPHQAFRIGQAYGLQFHVEVNEAMITTWTRDMNSKERAAYVEPPQPSSLPQLQQLAASCAKGFLSLVSNPASRNLR